MKIDIIVPAAGESVTEADIASWSVQDGDTVAVDDVLLELETDKASLELTAEAAGIVSIKVAEGETVKVGDVIGVIDTDAIAAPTSTENGNATTDTPADSGSGTEGKRVDIIVPAAGESVTEADIAEWSKSNGDLVALDEGIVELETDKASLELTAEAAGTLTILIEEGTVKVGDVLGFITTGAGSSQTTSASKPISATPSSTSENYATGHPSPAAAKLMAEKNVQLDRGTGKDGRITKGDVLNAPTGLAASAASDKSAKIEPAAAPQPAQKVNGERTTRREKMSRLRRTLSNRLVEAQQTAALLTTFNEVDMTEVMAVRKKYKEAFKEKYHVGLGFMSFFTKAAAIALQEFPILNAQVDGTDIIYHDYADIGIAVATPKGLVVPVVKNVESMNFSEVESAIMNFAKRGRDGQLTPDEMTGGTFTITNGGVFGSMLSTPIVNRPQSAILGMHNIVQRPMAVDGEVKIRPIMYLAVTYDHRIIDGADAVQFLVRIKELLEDPTRIMLNI